MWAQQFQLLYLLSASSHAGRTPVSAVVRKNFLPLPACVLPYRPSGYGTHAFPSPTHLCPPPTGRLAVLRTHFLPLLTCGLPHGEVSLPSASSHTGRHSRFGWHPNAFQALPRLCPPPIGRLTVVHKDFLLLPTCVLPHGEVSPISASSPHRQALPFRLVCLRISSHFPPVSSSTVMFHSSRPRFSYYVCFLRPLTRVSTAVSAVVHTNFLPFSTCKRPLQGSYTAASLLSSGWACSF